MTKCWPPPNSSHNVDVEDGELTIVQFPSARRPSEILSLAGVLFRNVIYLRTLLLTCDGTYGRIYFGTNSLLTPGQRYHPSNVGDERFFEVTQKFSLQ